MNKVEYFVRLLGNLYEYKKGTVYCRFLPTSIFLEPTNVCNLKCIMCPNKDLPQTQKGFMEFSFFKNIINEASSFARYINLFLTGEPFSHPQILEMISYIKSKGLMVKIHTNGTLLTKDISEKLIASNVDLLSISLDGYNAETYNTIRKNGDFEKTLEKAKSFLKVKKDLGSKKPFTIIQTLIMNKESSNPSNRKRLEKLFEGLPVDRFNRIFPVKWPGQSNGENPSSRKDLRYYQPCIDVWFTMNILWNGDIVPCCGDYSGAYVIGNAGEISLKEAWNSSKITKLREYLTQHPPQYDWIELCKKCDRLFEEKVLGVPTRNLKYFLKERFHL